MKAKWFVMASVVALPGFVASAAMGGCSSDTSEPVAAAPDASNDAPVIKPKDAAIDTEEPDTGPATCPTTTPLTATDLPLQWKPPPPVDNDCTQDDIDKLKAAFKASTSGSVKFTDIKTALGTACSSCVFSPVQDEGGLAPTWSVYVEPTGGGAVDNRTASCFARLESENCGKTRYQFESCLRVACKTADCVTDAKLKTCFQDAQKTACKALTTEYVAACADEADLLAACNVYASIGLSCAGGADAGIDSSPP